MFWFGYLRDPDLKDGAERDGIWDIDAVRILLLRDHGTAAGDVELRVQ